VSLAKGRYVERSNTVAQVRFSHGRANCGLVYAGILVPQSLLADRYRWDRPSMRRVLLAILAAEDWQTQTPKLITSTLYALSQTPARSSTWFSSPRIHSWETDRPDRAHPLHNASTDEDEIRGGPPSSPRNVTCRTPTTCTHHRHHCRRASILRIGGTPQLGAPSLSRSDRAGVFGVA
jgi:hypothetical protein